MVQYIDKDTLVAWIERRGKINKECMLGLKNLDYYQGKVDALNDTLSFINALEVKEVDSDKYEDGYEQGHADAVKEACGLLAMMIWEVTYEDLEGNSVQNHDKMEFIEEIRNFMERGE